MVKDIKHVLAHPELLERRLNEFRKEKRFERQKPIPEEIDGHIQKSLHNLEFVQKVIGDKFVDWAITGCYYAIYHAAIALIMNKGFASKNHDATLCLLIKEYYRQGISEEDIDLFHKMFIDTHDVLFYVEAKRKRRSASYSSRRVFDKKEANDLRLKAIAFISKAREILGR